MSYSRKGIINFYGLSRAPLRLRIESIGPESLPDENINDSADWATYVRTNAYTYGVFNDPGISS